MTTEQSTGLVFTPRASDRDPVRFNRRRKIVEVSLAVSVPVLLLVVLQLGADLELWNRVFYPSVTDVWRELVRMFSEKDFGYDLWVTVKRLLLGYVFGSLIGLFFGFVLGLNRLMRKALEPTLNAFYTIPKIALLAPLLIAFGFYDKPVVILISITVFFPWTWLCHQ